MRLVKKSLEILKAVALVALLLPVFVCGGLFALYGKYVSVPIWLYRRRRAAERRIRLV